MGRADPTMQMIAVMQEFGWTYDQYMNTPLHIIEIIKGKMVRDRKRQELQSKQT